MDYSENNHIDILISRYLMGNASSQEIEELFNWIKLSDENKRYFHRQQDIWAVLNPAMDIDDVNTDNAEQRVLRKTGITANKRPFVKKFIFIWSRIAAVAVLPLIAIIGFFILRAMDDTALDDVTITTAFGSMSCTNLPDGSSVWLNANSSLTYSPEMNSGTRDVFLHGEAYFEVKSDAANPFNVHTPYITVTAKGTEFNVNAYDKEVTTVYLKEGKVRLTERVTGRQNRYLMAPDEMLAVDRNARTCRAVRPAGKSRRWRMSWSSSNGIMPSRSRWPTRAFSNTATRWSSTTRRSTRCFR